MSLVLNFGLVDLATAIAPSPEWEPVRMIEAGWGIVFGVLLPIGFAAQLRRGGGPVATVQQLIVVVAAMALATLLTLKAHEWLLVAFWAAVTTAIVALHPARAQVFARGRHPDPILALVAALALVPAVTYTAQMAANHRAGLPGDNTNSFEHWTIQAALPLSLAGLVALSALKTDGWRVPAIAAAIGAAIFGALGVVDNGSLGDVSTGWGAGALEWAVVVLLAVARARRREIHPSPHTRSRHNQPSTPPEPLGEAAIVEPGPPAATAADRCGSSGPKGEDRDAQGARAAAGVRDVEPAAQAPVNRRGRPPGRPRESG